jgi:hypothetical protein
MKAQIVNDQKLRNHVTKKLHVRSSDIRIDEIRGTAVFYTYIGKTRAGGGVLVLKQMNRESMWTYLESYANYDQVVAEGELLIGNLTPEYARELDIFGPDEDIEIIPEFFDPEEGNEPDFEGETGDWTGFVTCQTWGTWNPMIVDRVCIDHLCHIRRVATWKESEEKSRPLATNK